MADCSECFYEPLCSCIKGCICLNSFKKTSFSGKTPPYGPVVTYCFCCRYDCIQKDRSNLWVVIDTAICRKSDTLCVYCHRPLELQLMWRPRISVQSCNRFFFYHSVQALATLSRFLKMCYFGRHITITWCY